MLTVVVFGATGSAGACVVRQCLASPRVGELRLVTRRPLALRDPRITTVLRNDFARYDDGDATFAGTDLCLWCLGKSVSQVDGEAAYRRITYDFAMTAAAACAKELKKRTLTNLYNQRPAWLDLAHRRLDEAVFAAYGWPPSLTDDELLARLLELNLARSSA